MVTSPARVDGADGCHPSALNHAHRYAELGFRVLPLHRPVWRGGKLVCSCGRRDCPSPAKHPYGALVTRGVQDASRNHRTIEKWFRNSGANVGIATGAISGLFALDIDPRHDGDETLAALERERGALPQTVRFLTGGGGEHVLFRHPGGRILNSVRTLGPGIDVRGDGGYIVGPPSRHICGRTYAISVDHHPDHVGLANAPAWLLERVYRRADDRGLVRSSPQNWRAAIGRTITEGERNSTLTSLAGCLLRRRVDPYVALDLLHAWNAAHCRPPLPDAEVTATVRSIARREIERREGRQNG